jgi:shikimate kinase
MQGKRNIVLVGFMGTGKTSVGRRLADALGLEFLDMDHVIEQREGKPISRIFAEDGEPYFRVLERSLARELSARGGRVVATGGGIVLNPDNIRDFSPSGLVVCLLASPEAILARVEKETHRPLLACGDKLQKIRALLDSRLALYEAIPVRIDTDGLSAEQVANRVLALYRATGNGAPLVTQTP